MILKRMVFRACPKHLLRQTFFYRAALKGTNLRGQTPICGFLRVPAAFCGFLRKSAVSCENPRFPSALFSRKRRESAKLSENLRLGSVCPLRFGDSNPHLANQTQNSTCGDCGPIERKLVKKKFLAQRINGLRQLCEVTHTWTSSSNRRRRNFCSDWTSGKCHHTCLTHKGQEWSLAAKGSWFAIC